MPDAGGAGKAAPAAIVRRGDRYAVCVERPSGLRLGPVLHDALKTLRSRGTRPAGFNIVPARGGLVTLEWIFACEDDARSFADAIAAMV